MEKETRYINLKNPEIEIREEEGNQKKIIGFIPYNLKSNFMGFLEVITDTAFNKTLNDGADVKALVNHKTDKILGRVRNETLKLISTSEGLFCEVVLPNVSYANDLYESIKRNDVNEMSFGFQVIKDNWKEEEGNQVRYLTEVKLLEVSYGVVFPAYNNTDTHIRNIEEMLNGLKNTELKELRDYINKDLSVEKTTDNNTEVSKSNTLNTLERELKIQEIKNKNV